MTVLSRLYWAKGEDPQAFLAAAADQLAGLRERRPVRVVTSCCGREVLEDGRAPRWYRGVVAEYPPERLRVRMATDAVEIGVEP